MKLNIVQLLEKSFVISIDNTSYENFCNIFSLYNLNTPLPKLFKGFTIPNGTHKKCGIIKTNNIINCTLSHITLIKMAQLYNFPYICVFEDDALPDKKIIQKLGILLDNIPNDSDMIKLGNIGYVKNDNIININEFFDVNNNTYGSHAYIIFEKYYSKYLDNMNKCLIADHLSMNDKSSNIYCTKYPLFIQNNTLGLHKAEPLELCIQTYSKQYILDNFNIQI